MSEFLGQDIKFLPGVGPKRAELLKKELKIETFSDLLYYFPYKYIDRTKFYKIGEINAQMPHIQVKGKSPPWKWLVQARNKGWWHNFTTTRDQLS